MLPSGARDAWTWQDCPEWFTTLAQPPAPRGESHRRDATGVLVGFATE
ncbi:hypothetical protein ACFRKB_22150 [Streptomyces scopuliridis]